MTRDRVAYDAIWNGRRFTLRRHRRLGARRRRAWPPAVAAQAEVAIDAADAVMLVVDATVGATDTDEAVVQRAAPSRASRSSWPRTRSTTSAAESEAAALWNLGLGEPYPVSALHGRGSGDLLDAVLDALPEAPRGHLRHDRRSAPGRAARQAERRQVQPAQPARRRGPGRRRPGGRHDRRPRRRADRARRQDLAVRRHRRHPAAGARGVRARVLRVAPYAGGAREGRGRRRPHRRQRAARRAGHRASCRWSSRPAALWCSRTTSGTCSTTSAATTSSGEIERELDPDALGAAGERLRADRPAHGPARPGARDGARELGPAGPDRPAERVPRRPRRGDAATRCAAASSRKILFATQAATRPPKFVVFASGFLEASYRRFIERRLREEFGFDGHARSRSTCGSARSAARSRPELRVG